MEKQQGAGKPVAVEATILLSGGIDSAACAHLLMQQGATVRGVFFDYGQAAAAPVFLAAKRLEKTLRIPVKKFKFPSSTKLGAGELTGRNAFLIWASIFVARAHTGLVGIGIHSGTPYYDCSATFLERMRVLVEEHTEGGLTLVAPFVDWSKGQIFDYFIASKLRVDQTYSCEAGTNPPCGICASCGDRRALGC